MHYSKTSPVVIGLLYLLILFNTDRIHNHQPSLIPLDTCPSYILSVTSKADGFVFHPNIPQIPFSPGLIQLPENESSLTIPLSFTQSSRAPPFAV
ncbi:MAG TPA: hypothetical protein EYP36_12135 [Calditrichaeota bacterium]|nr:hypothetical protein [Calditrichota bacterium]